MRPPRASWWVLSTSERLPDCPWASGSETELQSQARSVPEATRQEHKVTAVRRREDAGSPGRGTEEGPWGRNTRTPGLEDTVGTQDGHPSPPCGQRWARGTRELGQACGMGQPLDCVMTELVVVLGKNKFKGFREKMGDGWGGQLPVDARAAPGLLGGRVLSPGHCGQPRARGPERAVAALLQGQLRTGLGSPALCFRSFSEF